MLTLPDHDIQAIADLHWDLAPVTCQTIWDRLPLEGNLHHGVYSGPEVCMSLVGDWPPTTPENQTHRARPGDVVYWHQPAGRYRAAPAGECEFVIYYAEGGGGMGPEGLPFWMNVLANIRDEDLPAFTAGVRQIRDVVPVRLRVERGG